MSAYGDLVSRATGETDPKRLAMVEEQMRCDNGGTLDHLDRRRFDREARIARDVIDAMKAEMPGLYARLEEMAR